VDPPTRALADQTRPRAGPGRRVLLLLGTLALVVNTAFALALLRVGGEPLVPRPERSARVSIATAIDETRFAVATLANEVVWLENGQPVRTASFANLIGGLAVAPDRAAVYVGTSDGQVAVLDAALQPRRTVEVPGRVVGLRATRDGFLVAHGIGAFSDRYYVSSYPSDAAQPRFVKQVEFTISSMDAFPDRIAYATTNGRVGVLRASDGEQLWLAMAQRPVTRVAAVEATDRVLVGDDRGNAGLYDGATGRVVWETNVTAFPVRSVAYDERSGDYLVGDTQGNVFALDEHGWTVFSARAAASSVEALLPAATGLTGVPREGDWFTVQPAAMRGAALAAQLRLGWVAADAALLALASVVAVAGVPRWRAAAARVRRGLWRSRTAYAFVLPSLSLIVVFSYYPALMAFYYSFTNFSLRNVTEFVGLRNYLTVLTTDFYFRVGIVNMLLILVASILKVLTVPLLAAELVFWLRNGLHRYLFRTLVVFPAVVPDLVGTLLWRWIYDPRVGLINQLLGLLGLQHLQRAWLAEDATAIWAIIFTGFPFLGAFAFLIYMGGLLNINAELFDAAQIDGASWWRRFWHVDVPLLEAQFRLLLFFSFAGAIQGFANILIFTRGGPGYATYVPALQMYLQIADGGDFGYASAIGTLLFALIFVGTLLILRARRPAAGGAPA
jgi:ABC-type sugar transport system permease subunit/outer membrane protein assembly factor BamB